MLLPTALVLVDELATMPREWHRGLLTVRGAANTLRGQRMTFCQPTARSDESSWAIAFLFALLAR